MKKWSLILSVVFNLFLFFPSSAQQVPDTAFTFPIRQAAYPKGEGPVVFIDQAHNNMHTREGGFFAFSRLLEQDGYRVRGLATLINETDELKECRILVIANALDSSDLEDWILPDPSAFSEEEISIIRQWVKDGGRLLLIADHMPFAGAASVLGNAFGFEFLNGFAFTARGAWPPSMFTRKDKTLPESPIVEGNYDYEKIDQVATFTGSAFKAPEDAIPVLGFLQEHYILLPDTAWSFNAQTPRKDLNGCYQGAILQFGKGRVAVFGEAAMFTAQVANGTLKAGFNSEVAPKNAQFVLNLIHWLDAKASDNVSRKASK